MYDVVIVGGAAIGSAVAYFLVGELGFCGRVLVVEKDGGYASSSTARSAGGIRQQFSIPENVRMSLFGAEFLRAAPHRLAVGGEEPQIGFVERGYLFLVPLAGVAQLRANHAVQTACGAAVDLLDPAALAVRFPWLDTDGIAAGSFGPRNEGWLDPYGLMQAFRRKARALGVTYVQDRAVGFDRTGGRIAAVHLAAGGRVPCGRVVNAAGPAAGAVAALAGIMLPVGPRRRSVFVVHCREALPRCPLTIDVTGVWFRPEGENFICGASPPADSDPESWDEAIDHAQFDEVVWPALAARVPAFEALRVVGGWAGHYDYNALDQNAVLGPHPELSNFLFANGFSGHGLQQSPAVGRAIAELIVHGRYVTLDLSALGYERIAAGRPYREAAVV